MCLWGGQRFPIARPALDQIGFGEAVRKTMDAGPFGRLGVGVPRRR